MPTASDLVTDLPADFEIFGQAVATSMADLLGGTTGQVLSKASNTDMDFTWVTSDDANAIQNAIVDAKGDLIAASAADTPARLAVGNNGETLVADSSTSTGLRYQGSIAGGRNFCINGGFDVWQRSTSSSSNNGYFTADRWAQYNAAGSGTYAQTTSVPAGQRYAMRFTSSADGTLPGIYMAFETSDVVRLAGQTVTVSAWLKSSGSIAGNIQLNSATGTDQAWNTTFTLVSTTSVTTSTSWVRYSGQFAIPSNATSLRLDIYSGAVANAGTFEIAGVQMELGSVATNFSRAGGTIQGELAACQRYYYFLASGADTHFANGNYNTGSLLRAMISFPVAMRTTPSVVATSGTDFYQAMSFATADNFNSVNFGNGNPNGVSIFNNTEISGTGGQGCIVKTNNASASVAFSAEL